MTKRKIEGGSINVFADLGRPDAENHLVKARLVAEIYRLANERALKQAAVGKIVGISQPEVSRLFRGHFREYSIERLMGFLTRFDRDVEILIHPPGKRGKPGKIIVSPAAA
jgi:predicted XRE-type DNA-binding protein